jgi:Na+/H+-dicarboxylate symporter
VGLPVFYTLTEIGNLLAVCGPALCLGVAALVLATRGPLPTWLRVFSVLAGVCGVLAPFYFTYFVYALWTLVAGITWTLGRSPQRVRDSEPSMV